jgi:hypothetical protein
MRIIYAAKGRRILPAGQHPQDGRAPVGLDIHRVALQMEQDITQPHHHGHQSQTDHLLPTQNRQPELLAPDLFVFGRHIVK